LTRDWYSDKPDHRRNRDGYHARAGESSQGPQFMEHDVSTYAMACNGVGVQEAGRHCPPAVHLGCVARQGRAVLERDGNEKRQQMIADQRSMFCVAVRGSVDSSLPSSPDAAKGGPALDPLPSGLPATPGPLDRQHGLARPRAHR
jgi:hypothetical protein